LIIGVPKEIKNNENRVGMTPASVTILTQHGHTVLVEKNAGQGSGFVDDEYIKAGAQMVSAAKDAWSAEMVVKVKEPLEEEYGYFREGMVIFAYFHLAAEERLTKELIKAKITAIAYETVQDEDGTLPLLTPMSEVAGRKATFTGAQFLEKYYGGKGILLGGVPGVKPAKVTIIGGGVVGMHAAKMALGLGADVTVLDTNPKRLRELSDIFGHGLKTLISNSVNIANEIADSDLAIGAVLIPGAKAPVLVTEEMVKGMKSGSVIVDVAIDQGGIFETIDRITTHDHPTFEKFGVLHYAVANMPGAVPRTSTIALTNCTIPYALELANKGYKKACLENISLYKGINVLNGFVTYKSVAEAFGLEHKDAREILL
jgi:alanine dehydrogenase